MDQKTVIDQVKIKVLNNMSEFDFELHKVSDLALQQITVL